MKRRLLQAGGAVVVLLLLVAIVAPYLDASSYGRRLQWSLQRSLGRQVDIGQVRFSLWRGPAFVVERNGGPGLIIHEDPSIGIEPIAYIDTVVVRPSFWQLLRGRFVISSIQLEDGSLNLAKPEGGRWNFLSFVDRSVMSTAPAIHVRNGRVNFRFGDTKSVVYLTETDLDISPPGSLGGGWSVYCAAQPARTDRPSYGLGLFTVRGRWFLAPERLDLDVNLDRTGLSEWTALFRGQSGAVHGMVTSRLHLGGAINNIGIQGRLTLADVHRWDLLPPSGQGWPLDIRGRLDLVGEQLEVQSSSASNEVLPLSVRFRVSDYLTSPHWAAAINWNRFPVAPLMDIAAHMGAEFPAKLKLGGAMDGALTYSGDGKLQGTIGFHDTSLTIPDSPPVRAERAYIVFDGGHARLTPVRVETADHDSAQLEADYAWAGDTLDLTIHSDAMKVASLRAQVALAAVPWLEQLQSGAWSGDLHYHHEATENGWAGRLTIEDARVDVPGLAAPVDIAFARAQIDGPRVVLDQLDAQAGKVEFGGEYRYEPGAARPHRVRIRAAELDASDVEALLLPTLRRDRSLIARALGRNSLPDWLKARGVEGTILVDELTVGGTRLAGVRGLLRWDGARIELENVQAKLDRAAFTGRLTIGLRSAEPVYKVAGKVKGFSWQNGKVDAEGTLETSGTGAQLLAKLTSETAFTGSALDFGGGPLGKTVSGTCTLAWSPKLKVTGLNLKTDDENYTGAGRTLDDGRLLIQLTNGAHEVRMVGTVAKLRLEEPAK
jgi:hypothetical protein